MKSVIKKANITLPTPAAIQVKSCKDHFLAYQFYLVCYAAMGRLSALRKYNMDATTHVFENIYKGSKVAVLANDKEYENIILLA